EDDKKNKKRKDDAENENPENEVTKDEETERMFWLRAVIDELATEGFRGADIGVLARGKKELAKLSDYFTRWSEEAAQFRFSSEDSLKLDLSDGIQILIAGLKLKAGIDTAIN